MKLKWGGFVALMREKRREYRTSIGKPEGRARRRWKDNFKMNLKEIVWEGVEWIRLAQGREGCANFLTN
jgi:hypothetical protein